MGRGSAGAVLAGRGIGIGGGVWWLAFAPSLGPGCPGDEAARSRRGPGPSRRSGSGVEQGRGSEGAAPSGAGSAAR